MNIGHILTGGKLKIPAAKFKANCLQLMDEIQKSHEEVVITKHGKEVAKLVPTSGEQKRPLFGFLSGSARILGDIVQSTGEDWDVER